MNFKYCADYINRQSASVTIIRAQKKVSDKMLIEIRCMTVKCQ